MPRVKRAPRKYNARRGAPRSSAYGRRVAFLGGRRMYKSRPRRYAVEAASLKETVEVTFNNNVMNYYDAWSLGDLALERAPAVAKNYQYYKISKLEVKLLTTFDTFVAGGAAGTGIMPQCYWMINKGQSVPTGLGVDELLDMGCKPIPLNERNLNWNFAPAVLTGDRTIAGGVTANQYRISPWLNTNANVGGPYQVSQIEHGGFIIFVSPINPGDTSTYKLQVTYHFKFKKPLISLSEGAPAQATYKNGEMVPIVIDPASQTSPTGA